MVREIPLTRGYVALVDDEDYELVSRWKWRVHINQDGRTYAVRTINHSDGSTTTVRLHRFLIAAPVGEMVDHRNGDGLDCQRLNIRRASPGQNAMNRGHRKDSSSPFKGIRINPHRGPGRWYAYIRVGGRVRVSKTVSSPEEAARLYDDLARQYFGEFAAVNFPALGERGA